LGHATITTMAIHLRTVLCDLFSVLSVLREDVCVGGSLLNQIRTAVTWFRVPPIWLVGAAHLGPALGCRGALGVRAAGRAAGDHKNGLL
jgi:hypothetical protein